MNKEPVVLIVDDDPVTQVMLELLFEPEGYCILQAENGTSGCEQAVATPPDVVLLDVILPDMDGFEICRRLRATRGLEEVPILMITSLDDKESRLRGFESGADDFITKPFDDDVLRARVRTIVRLNRYRRRVEQQRMFHQAIESLSDGFVLLDSEDRLVACNSRYEKIYPTLKGRLAPGISFEELLRISVHGGQYAEAAGREDTWIEERMALHRAGTDALEQQLDNGRWLLINERKTKDGYTVGLRTDITDLKRREDELRRSEEALYRANREWEETFHAVPDPIAILDTERQIVKANKAMAALVGVSAAELVGQTCFPWVQCSEGWLQECPFERMLNDHREHSSELFDQGLQSWFFVTVSPLFDQQGVLVGAVNVARDITERKQSEQERLAQAEKQKNLLVREVHHRIKNHLHGLMGLLQNRQTEHPEAGESIGETIAQIHSIATVYGLQSDYVGAQVQFLDMLAAIIQSHGANDRHHISVSHELSSRDPDGTLVSDSAAVPLALVVNELLQNAVKHFDPAACEKLVEVGIVLRDDTATLKISNPGRLPTGFDLPSGRGVGTGLDLVRTLMPREGATLSILESNGIVEVVLNLSAPLLFNSQ